MHATGILSRALWPALEPMHGGRRKVLMRAVDSLIGGRRLTLTDLARSWPGATFAHAPLKRRRVGFKPTALSMMRRSQSVSIVVGRRVVLAMVGKMPILRDGSGFSDGAAG